MAWPPSPSSAFLVQTGGLQVKWGTDGIWSTYAMVSCTPNDEIETLYVENGTGLKAVRIILWQGRRMNFTVVDDVTITPPKPGDLLNSSFVDPLTGVTHSPQFRVIENSYNAARKEAGQRVIVAEFLTLIEGGGTPPN